MSKQRGCAGTRRRGFWTWRPSIGPGVFARDSAQRLPSSWPSIRMAVAMVQEKWGINGHRKIIIFYWLITLVERSRCQSCQTAMVDVLKDPSFEPRAASVLVGCFWSRCGCGAVTTNLKWWSQIRCTCTYYLVNLDVLRLLGASLWKGKLSDYSTWWLIFGHPVFLSLTGYVQSSMMRLSWILQASFVLNMFHPPSWNMIKSYPLVN